VCGAALLAVMCPPHICCRANIAARTVDSRHPRPCVAPMGALRAAALAHRHAARRGACHGLAFGPRARWLSVGPSAVGRCA